MAEAPRSRLRLAGLGGRTLAVIAVLVLAVAAADRSGLRLDASADRRFTLDPALVEIVRAQREPVGVVGIWSAADDSVIAPLSEAVQRVVALNPSLSWRRIDPERDKPLLEAHRQRFRDASWPAFFLTRGERAFKIPITGATRARLQQELGGGLLALADPTPPGFRLLSGHGELAPEGGDEGCDALVRTLELAGFVRDAGGAIDPRTVVVAPGPTAPLGPETIAALEQHLVDGGPLLVFADDRIPADLATLLRRRGLMVGVGIPKGVLAGDATALFADAPEPAPPAVVVSLRHHFAGQESQFPYYNLLVGPQQLGEALGDPAGLHPVLAPQQASGRNLLSPWSTPVLSLDLDPAQDGELIEALAKAGRLPAFAAPPARLFTTLPGDAWLTPRQRPPEVPKDLAQRPAIPLAALAEYRPDPRAARQTSGARVVVWGSRAAASNRVLGQEQWANAALTTDLARWLADRGRATAIPVAETASYRIVASDRGLWLVIALVVAILPCLAIGGAILAWLDRR